MKKLIKIFSLSDRKIFNLLNNKFKCTFFDIFMPYITKIGGVSFSVALPLLLIFFGEEKMRAIGVECLTSLFASHLVVQVLKRLITRQRPYNIFKNINTFNIFHKDYSFPSGHTTASFSLATVFSLNIPSFMLLFMSISSIVGISRVYLGVHYPSDIIVGIVLGSMTSIFIHPYFII